MNIFLILFSVGFLVAVAIAGAMATIPSWVGMAYVGVSVVTFAVYAWDKHRARTGRGRTAEKTLHLFEFIGGWPGGLLGQRILRHKNRKLSYQRVFWFIVVLHLVAWGWLAGIEFRP